MEEYTVRKIGEGEYDLGIEFEHGGTLRIFGLDEDEKLVIREGTDRKREKAIHGKDLVSVAVHTDGGREIIDWPLNDDNARSEGFWAWMQRLICHPDIEASPLDGDPYKGTPNER